jgi:hypothetical protein
VPALKGCHTQALSLDDLMERIRKAIELCSRRRGASPQAADLDCERESPVPPKVRELIAELESAALLIVVARVATGTSFTRKWQDP